MEIMKIPFSEIIGYLKAIKEVGDKNKKILQRVEQVQDQDREDYRELERRLAHVEAELKTFAVTVSKIPNQTRDKVAEAAESIVDEAQDLKEVIIDKKVVAIDRVESKKQMKPWWKFW